MKIELWTWNKTFVFYSVVDNSKCVLARFDFLREAIMYSEMLAEKTSIEICER